MKSQIKACSANKSACQNAGAAIGLSPEQRRGRAASKLSACLHADSFSGKEAGCRAVFGRGFLFVCACVFLFLSVIVLSGCSRPINAPRELSDYAGNTLFSSFSGRSPRTLDPQQSYSSDETIYVYGVYEMLYGYHYLKRPYELVPRAAEKVVVPTYYDKDGKELPADADSRLIARAVYRIPIKKGMKFAPHPAFAKDDKGNYLYHHLRAEEASKLKSPLDLPARGTREVTAEDFVYGIKRLGSPVVVSPVFGMMANHIVGLKVFADNLSREAKKLRKSGDTSWLDLRKYEISGVRAADRYTIEITLNGKYNQFSNWLSMAFFAPVPWEAEAFYHNEGFKENNISLATWPVGAGPFMLTKSLVNREHVLERNPNYRFEPYPCEGMPDDEEKGLLADCGKPTPFVDRVVMSMEKEAIPTTTKFLQGYYDSPQITRLDVGQGYLVAMGDDPDKAKLYRGKNLQFPSTIEASISYIGFNWLDPVVGAGKTPEEARRNRLLRQAISIALDWEEEIAIFSKGQGKAAHGPLPPGLFGWRDDGPEAFNDVVYKKAEDGRVVRRSIEEARELMAQAGYPDGRDAKTGKPLVLNFDWQSASPGSKAYLEWVTKQFAKLGIQLEIRATDYNRFQEKMLKGSAQIYLWGWLADYPDAENFFTLLYGPNSKVISGGGENASNYANPEFDKRFERMKDLENGPQKACLIDEMTRIVQHDAPWSFGYYPTSVAALQHWVKNAKPTQMIRYNVQYMRIDAKERVEKINEWNRPIIWPVVMIFLAAGVLVWRVRVHAAKLSARRAVEPNCSATRENEYRS